MAKSKFKVGDKVKIVSNEIEPQFVGQVGRVKKVYLSFSERQDENTGYLQKIALYRIEVGSKTLNGVALDSDLEPA